MVKPQRPRIHQLAASTRSIRIFRSRRHHPRPHRILLNIRSTRIKMTCILDPSAVITTLPHIHPALQPKRKSTFDQLRHLLKRHIVCRCHQQMNMVRHDHKRIKLKPPLRSILLQCRHEQLSRRRNLKQPSSLGCNSGKQVSSGLLRCKFHAPQNTRDNGCTKFAGLLPFPQAFIFSD